MAHRNQKVCGDAFRWGVIAAGLMAFTAAAPASFAQPMDAAGDEIVIVTGSRLPRAERLRAAIETEQIEARAADDVLDLMRQAPGVTLLQPGGAGGVGEVFLRGAESNFSVVLIDGVRVNDTTNNRGGGFDFSTIAPDELARIDIITSPLSAVYGSDAMAGVINLVTRAPGDQASGRWRAEVGENARAAASLSLSGPLGAGVRGSANAGYFSADGEGGAEEERRTGSARADFDWRGVSVQSGARLAHRTRASFPDGSGGALYAASPLLERAEADEAALWARSEARLGAHWTLDAVASYFSREEAIETPAVAPGVFDGAPASASDTSLDRTALTLHARREQGPLQIGFGLDVQSETGVREGALDFGAFALESNFDLERTQNAIFAETRYRPSAPIELAAALRVDEHDRGADRRVSGRISAASEVGHGLRVQALWANGHKAPSFYALGDTLVGNPALKDELSELSEIELRWRSRDGRTNAQLSAFRSHYEDLIDFDFTTFQLVNRNAMDVDGVQLQLDAQVRDDLRLIAHATFSEISGGADFEPLNRPETYGGAVIDWRPSADWVVQGHAQFIGKQASSSIPTGPRTLEAYVRSDFAVTRRIGAASVFLTAENLFDARIEESVGFLAPGRSVSAGIGYAF